MTAKPPGNPAGPFLPTDAYDAAAKTELIATIRQAPGPFAGRCLRSYGLAAGDTLQELERTTDCPPHRRQSRAQLYPFQMGLDGSQSNDQGRSDTS